jgi:hypothetical protein
MHPCTHAVMQLILTRLRLRRKKVPEIHFSHIKIRRIPGIFLNLSLNLNLAIFKMRISENIAKKVEKNIYLIYNSILKP